MRFFKNVWSQIHRFAFWAVILTLFWAWIYFSFVGDTTREKKVMLYMDVYALDQQGLSARLEDAGLPEGIKMIQVRSFGYDLFSTSAEGDVYVMKESLLKTVLEETPEKLSAIQVPADRTGYSWKGESWGILVFDAATQTGPAEAYARYTPVAEPEPENFYLCFDAGSPHLADGAAWTVAMNFLSVDD